MSTSFGNIPSVVVGEALSYLEDDPYSVLAARSSCQILREGCNYLPTQACQKLAIKLTIIKSPDIYLLNKDGCSSLFRSMSWKQDGYEERRGSSKQKVGHQIRIVSMESSLLKNEKKKGQPFGYHMEHPSHLLYAFFKPLDNVSTSPFSKLLQYMRCIDRLPNELAHVNSEIFGSVCVPLYTKLHRQKNNVDLLHTKTKFDSVTRDKMDSASETNSSEQIKYCKFDPSSIWKHNETSKFMNLPMDMSCPVCLHSSCLRIRHISYKSEPPIIYSWKDEGKFQPYFTPLRWQSEIKKSRNVSNPQYQVIHLQSDSCTSLLHGVEETKENDPYFYQRDIIVLSCTHCNNFGLIAPVAKCSQNNPILSSSRHDDCREVSKNQCPGMKYWESKSSINKDNRCNSPLFDEKLSTLLGPIKLKRIYVREICHSTLCQFIIPCTLCCNLAYNELEAKNDKKVNRNRSFQLCKWCS